MVSSGPLVVKRRGSTGAPPANLTGRAERDALYVPMSAPGLKRNELTQSQREFIVKKLAAFEPPQAIAAALAAVFPGAKVNENDILACDPRTTVVSPELHAVYMAERERVLMDPRSATFADQRARLIALSNQAEYYGNNRQPAEQRTVFRQIAEELGVVAGKGGKAGTPPQGEAPAEIVAITRTVIDPAAPAPQVAE